MSECIGCGLDEGYREHLRSRAENGAEPFISISSDDLLVLLRQVDVLEKEADWLAEKLAAAYPERWVRPIPPGVFPRDRERYADATALYWREAARKDVEEVCKK